MKEYDIVALGEILIDFTPYGRADDGCVLFGRNPGGAPANVLCTVAKYGGRAAFIGKVGDDMFGEFLRETLQSGGVDDTGLVTDLEHNTTMAFVTLDERGDRKFSFCRRFGADAFLCPDDVKAELVTNSKVFHFGSLSLTTECARAATDRALDLAAQSGAIVSFDPNYRPLLWNSEAEAARAISEYVKRADVAKLSVEEAEMATGEKGADNAGKRLVELGPSVALVTDGEKGARYYLKGGASGHVPAVKVKATDTTGAGDIFYGTFLFEMIKAGSRPDGMSESEVLRCTCAACTAAAISVTKKGAIPSIPEYKEIKKQ